jgi:hypothetical protein
MIRETTISIYRNYLVVEEIPYAIYCEFKKGKIKYVGLKYKPIYRNIKLKNIN